jgi:hypothetical protein
LGRRFSLPVTLNTARRNVAEVMNAQFRAALAERYRLERELGRGGMATVYLTMT